MQRLHENAAESHRSARQTLFFAFVVNYTG
nr:MAG TPA: hypothetical protein [Caudoviricetes sp.]